MLNWNTKKLDKANNDGAAGGSGYSGDPAKDASPASKDTSATKTDEKTGDNLDEFGYAKKPAAAEPAKEEKKEEPAKAVEPKLEDVKDPATGYGVKAPEPVKEEKKDPPAAELPKEGEIQIDTKGLDDKEAAKIKEFAKANLLSKEAAQAFVELKKSEIKLANDAIEENKKAQEKEIANIRSSWDKELREDKVFGGDKFAHNVLRAEKVLGDFMTETKKVLTERGSMLPPYVMRDLAKLSEHLYATDKFVQGDAVGGSEKPKDEGKAISPLDFYNHK